MRYMCACGQTLLVGFVCQGCVRDRSGASYVPYMCVDNALSMVNNADDSSLSKLCECLHQGLEEGEVVSPRGGVGVGVVDFSCGPALLYLRSCGG